jgi:hypothetical protein
MGSSSSGSKRAMVEKEKARVVVRWIDVGEGAEASVRRQGAG